MSEKTLIVCFGPLGRLLNAFCASARLSEAMSSGQLVLLTSSSLAGLAAKAPWFDDIISADLSEQTFNFSHVTKAIKQRKFDRIIDLQRDALTKNLFANFGFFAPKFAGAAPRAKWKLREDNQHSIDADDQLLDIIGVPKIERDLSIGPQLNWLLRLSGQTPSMQPGYFGLSGPYVLLNLGTPDLKHGWPQLAFAELAGHILSLGMELAITGDIHARDLARPLIRTFPQIRDLCARADPFQLASLGTQAKGVVGLADGILHLCAAGAGRCISLHGSQDNARKTAIRSPNAMTLIGDGLDKISADDVIRAMKMFGAL
ncbi:MAG: glycosyltransferase family 9 protein [Robiginitomaculum sp.]|nr:glycosyltransferase family 9 protein [Robiginitomaculum sp.]